MFGYLKRVLFEFNVVFYLSLNVVEATKARKQTKKEKKGQLFHRRHPLGQKEALGKILNYNSICLLNY